ncbi:MAG: hypothetical protein KDD74_17955 [Anaerolineales bacterium]|nr:hypothetical protein [Anaerolineales bacterium]
MRSGKDLLANSWFYLIVAFYILAGYTTLVSGDQIASRLFDEDRYFENIGAISLLASSLILFYGFWKSLKSKKIDLNLRMRQIFFIGLGVVFFFGFGEEISWGQRIFHIATPEAIAAINVQDETNIHNIAIFEYGLKFETVFDLMWGILAFAVPIAALLSKEIKRFVERFVVVPYLGIGLIFLFNYLMAKAAFVVFQPNYTFDFLPFAQAVQEVKESNYELLFVLYAINIIRNLSAD